MSGSSNNNNNDNNNDDDDDDDFYWYYFIIFQKGFFNWSYKLETLEIGHILSNFYMIVLLVYSV